MSKKVKPVDPNDKDAIIRQKDEEILRLRAENEYLKKLRAVVQARKDRQPKKK
jgi:transposase